MTRYHGSARNSWKLRMGEFLHSDELFCVCLVAGAMLYMAVR